MAWVAYGLAVEADLPLDLPSTDRRPDVVVERSDRPVDPRSIRWLDESRDGPWRAGKVGRWFLLRFLDRVDLLIAEDGTTVRWWTEESDGPTLVHLVLDHALPYCLMRRGHLALHGSCLALGDQGCFAMTGPSGAGKSTLAATMRRRGHRFLADDCVVVRVDGDVPTVVPAYPGIRLDRRSTTVLDTDDLREVGPVSGHSPKRRLALPPTEPWAAEDRHRLLAVFTLAPPGPVDNGGAEIGASPATESLSGAAALFALLPNSFHLAVGSDRDDVLDRMASVAESCAVIRLHYHHSGDGLRRAVDGIEAALDQLSDRSR
jgi:hypothetical protein